jgi:hypothetical protein
MVLPQPGPPHTIVGRPWGTPPLVISSNPAMPVRAFGNWGNSRESALRRALGVAKDVRPPNKNVQIQIKEQWMSPFSTGPHKEKQNAYYL